MIAEPTIRRVEHRGAVSRFKREILRYAKDGGAPEQILEYDVEGPRGTGKSNGTAFTWFKLCRTYKNVRILVLRTARTLLTDTFCKTYEEDVCPEHASVTAIQRIQRHEYYFPDKNSRIVLGGLDQPGRYLGGDWDIVDLEEAVQFRWKQVEPLLGSLRNGRLGFHALVYVTNPDAPMNWVNLRAKKGYAKRLECKHRDNPSLYDWDLQDWTPKGRAFMETLDRYTGVERARHRDGLWRGAEGMVWENFDENIHIIDEPDWRNSLKIVEYRGAMDWGTTHPGCFQVWGIDAAKRMTLVATIQQTGKTPDWWSQKAVELVKEFQIRRIVADPSQPGFMTQVNDWLAARGGNRIVYPANNKKASSGSGDMGGLALVRWGFERDATGVPRIRMLRNALRGPADPALVASSAPTWVAEEIPSYVHARDATGEFMYETTDKDLPDDGCDTMRYAATDNWGLSPQAPPLPPDPPAKPWTNEWQFGTPKSLELARIRREEGDDDDVR